MMKNFYFMRTAMQAWVNKSGHDMCLNNLVYFAVTRKNIPLVEMLVRDIHANPNIQRHGDTKETPLHYAIKNNQIEIIKILLASPEINVDILDSYSLGRPPLHNIKGLQQKDCLGILDIFIQAQASVNSKDKKGNTLLHNQSRYLTAKITYKLLTSPTCDINAQNDEGNTPLHEASFLNASVLIEKGADLNIYNHDGDTPLHKSIENKDEIVTKILIRAGANINCRNNKGNTPLHVAAANTYIIGVKDLLAAGAQRNIRNKDSQTAKDLTTNQQILALFRSAP